MIAKVSEEKRREVKKLRDLINKYRVVGIVDLTNMPSAQLQKMRKILKGVLIRVSKKRLLKIVFEDLKDSKRGIGELNKEMSDVMPCLILSNDSCFRLARLLRKNKSRVVAKAGQVAPNDIIVKAGVTPFTPGPIIGELGSLGIKAGVESGKIVIKEDCVLVKEGSVINSKKANVLAKLGIEPMEIGLKLVAAYENESVFRRDVLDIDDKWYLDKIKEIARDGFKLAISVGYICRESVEFLIKKVENEAKVLNNIVGVNKEIVEEKIVDGEKDARILESKIEDVNKKEEERKKKLEQLKKEPLKEKKPSAKEIINEVSGEIMDDDKKRVPSVDELVSKKKHNAQGG